MHVIINAGVVLAERTKNYNHYRNLALCRVPYSLPSATQKTLGKIKHSAKKLFAECFIFDTRQRVSLPSVFF
jgi:hypothetical protein